MQCYKFQWQILNCYFYSVLRIQFEESGTCLFFLSMVWSFLRMPFAVRLQVFSAGGGSLELGRCQEFACYHKLF